MADLDGAQALSDAVASMGLSVEVGAGDGAVDLILRNPAGGLISRGCRPTTPPGRLLHAQLWFADRALRLVRAVPEGRDVQLDDLDLVGELLQRALSNA